jgi:hypothetical protein
VGIDQERGPVIVVVLSEPCEMDLAHVLGRKSVEIGFGIVGVVDGRDEDVIDVEKEAAPGPTCDLGQKVNL